MPTDSPGRPRVILDCDPGHDDVIAIVVASHVTDLAGVTTVAGNAPLDRTTYNACVIRDAIDLDVEVHSGAERPLVAEPKFAGFVHGESGLDGADLPVPERGADSTDAVGFIIETCRASPGTWLVPTGPLTNIALAIRSAPDLLDHVSGISLMGGGTFGNRTPLAEFNVWADPEAAAVVFGSGADITMAGLDVTHQFLVTSDRIEQVAAMDSPFTNMITDLFRFFSENYISRHDRIRGAALHDPLAVLALARPDLFEAVDRHVAVETIGEHTAGMTVIDRRDISDREAPNVHVLERVDDGAAWDLVIEALHAANRRSTLRRTAP
ncbi:nucleoside hydrolase [Ilumatobacter sp.]|uniref:nucleoside hydrolase n=1 Tax=Ilumatobacter sp. TaxID=1967498 RepID=UPI003AF4EC1F